MKFTHLRLGALGSAALFAFAAAALAPAGSPEPGSVSLLSAAEAAPAKPAAKSSPKPPAAAKPAPAAATGEPSEAAKKAFMQVVSGIRQKILTAPNKEKAARDGLATLQKYARDHAREPIADSARLTAAHLQAQLGQTDEALATMRQIVAKPMDKQIGWAAEISMAQLLAESGKLDEAEKVLKAIITKNENAEVVEAAKNGLTAIAIRPGQKPPAFTAKDTAGNSQSPAGYEGKVLLIDFWATWCGPCREEMPNVKKVYEQYKDQGFAILGISLDREQTELDTFVKAEAIAWPQIHGDGQKLAELYAVTGIPRMLLLDRQGVIRYVDPRGEMLGKAVGELVKGEAKPAPQP